MRKWEMVFDYMLHNGGSITQEEARSITNNLGELMRTVREKKKEYNFYSSSCLDSNGIKQTMYILVEPQKNITWFTTKINIDNRDFLRRLSKVQGKKMYEVLNDMIDSYKERFNPMFEEIDSIRGFGNLFEEGN